MRTKEPEINHEIVEHVEELKCAQNANSMLQRNDGKPSAMNSMRNASQQPPMNENYQEYSAQINGNELIVRIRKDDPSLLVTRVYDNVDSLSASDSNKIISLSGCGQKIDFKLPNCAEECCQLAENDKKSSHKQKKSCKLPIIRGNIKYPGALNGMDFNFFNEALKKVDSSTEKFRVTEPSTRSIAMQINQNLIKQELDGVKKIHDKDGIEVCKKGSVGDCDVFIFKLGRKRIDANGETSQIELEMRTPKGPDTGLKRMETREVQVLENEFELIGDRKKKSEEIVKVETIDKKPSKSVGLKSNKVKAPADEKSKKPPKKIITKLKK